MRAPRWALERSEDGVLPSSTRQDESLLRKHRLLSRTPLGVAASASAARPGGVGVCGYGARAGVRGQSWCERKRRAAREGAVRWNGDVRRATAAGWLLYYLTVVKVSEEGGGAGGGGVSPPFDFPHSGELQAAQLHHACTEQSAWRRLTTAREHLVTSRLTCSAGKGGGGRRKSHGGAGNTWRDASAGPPKP